MKCELFHQTGLLGALGKFWLSWGVLGKGREERDSQAEGAAPAHRLVRGLCGMYSGEWWEGQTLQGSEDCAGTIGLYPKSNGKQMDYSKQHSNVVTWFNWILRWALWQECGKRIRWKRGASWLGGADLLIGWAILTHSALCRWGSWGPRNDRIGFRFNFSWFLGLKWDTDFSCLACVPWKMYCFRVVGGCHLNLHPCIRQAALCGDGM